MRRPSAPPVVHDVIESPGNPLDHQTRDFFEQRFHHDLAAVRIHTDDRAATAAEAVGAAAFTVGNHIAFGPGAFAPGTGPGRRLLAHELTHVFQQPSTNPPTRGNLDIGEPENSCEHQARQVASTINDRLAVPLARIASASRLVQREILADDPFPEAVDGEQPQQLTLSDEGFEFLKRHEGVVKKLYNDSQGHCTIGVGHLVHKGKCDGSEPQNFKDGLTDDEVDQLFRADLETYESAVSNAITSRINQYQYDALVSFTFNVGTGAFRGSGVLKEINAKNYSKVPAELLKWNKPPEIQGRRADEANLFRTGTY